ncbi:hypothetical protein Droror1_Dr00020841 [Drosera rotundifolia]
MNLGAVFCDDCGEIQLAIGENIALELDPVAGECMAVRLGLFQVLSWLLDRDMNPDLMNRYEQTPLMVAAMNGKLSCVQKLFNAGANANGSARVRLGETEVIASVKAELGKPSASQPDKGKVFINVDCSSTASPAFARCLLGSNSGAGAGIDRTALCVSEGKICWDLYIDGLVVGSDGNVLDALGAAIKPEVDVSDEEFQQFDTSAVPVIVMLTKVGMHYIVDATTEEESHMSSAISISINKKGHICGMTKRGAAGLDPSVIHDMISVAKHVSEEFMNKLDSEIAAAEAAENE